MSTMNILKFAKQINYSKLTNKLWKFIKKCFAFEESLVKRRIRFYEDEIENCEDRMEVVELSKIERTKKITVKLEQYKIFLNNIIKTDWKIYQEYENTCTTRTVDMDCTSELILESTIECSSSELPTDNTIVDRPVFQHNSWSDDGITDPVVPPTQELKSLNESSAYSDLIIPLLDKSSIIISSIKKEIDTYKCECESYSRTLNELSKQTGPAMNTTETQTDQMVDQQHLKYRKHMETIVQKLKSKIRFMEKKLTLYEKNEKCKESASICRLENIIKDLKCQQTVYKDKNIKLKEERDKLNENVKDTDTLQCKMTTIKSELCHVQENLKASNEENLCLKNKMQSLLDFNNLQSKVCVKSADCQTDITEEQLLGEILLTSEIRNSELSKHFENSTDSQVLNITEFQ